MSKHESPRAPGRRSPQRLRTTACALALVLLAGGCSIRYVTGPTATSPLPSADLKAEWHRMKAEPTTLERPLVVIDGWIAIGAPLIAGQLRKATGATKDDVLVYQYAPLFGTLESNAARVIELVERRWPGADPEWTTEVDVVGFSMGGIVARVGATDPARADKTRKKLRIHTLYTVSTPHRRTARPLRWLPVDQMSFAVGQWSDRLERLDEALPGRRYTLLAYGQGYDPIVHRRSAPPGHTRIAAKGLFLFSHLTSCGNIRHLADIAARLRGDPPLAPTPPDAQPPGPAVARPADP